MPTPRIPLLVAALSFAACSSVSLSDDVDTVFDFTPWQWSDSSELHEPYVAGATLTLWVHGNHERVDHWKVQSTDSHVALIGAAHVSSESLVGFDLAAKAPGTATLKVIDDNGDTHVSRDIHVLQPDRVDLLPHGPLLLDGVASPEESPQLLAGGTGTFMARYYAGKELLHGNGALSATAEAGVTATVVQTAFLESRDWLIIDGQNTSGPSAVTLRVAGQVAKTWPVSVVQESAIDHVILTGQDESAAHKDENLLVYAQAFSVTNAPIYGVEYSFTANGVAQTGNDGMGDIYRYRYDPSLPVMLEATHGAHVEGVKIKSEGGVVSSSNHIGCDTVPGRTSDGGVVIGLLGLFLLACRLLQPRNA